MQRTAGRTTANERRAYIARVIAAAPPPTPEQIARVCGALRPPVAPKRRTFD